MSDNTSTAGSLPEVERVLEAAKDSVTDDMVSRLAENGAQALDLLDKLNRSGVDKALPALAQMVHNGDLDRLCSLARVYGAAEDAASDDMVGRFTEMAGTSFDLLDRLNRSGFERALPVLARLLDNGDLQRVVDIARTVAAAEDAMNDDMVGRVAQMAAEALSVIDRLNRSGVERLIDILDRLNHSGSLDILADKLPSMIKHIDMIDQLAGCLTLGAHDAKQLSPPPGGVMAMVRLMGDAENQAALQFLMSIGKRMRVSCDTGKN